MEGTKRGQAVGESRSRARRTEELYAHLIWHTWQDAPLLEDEQVTEAIQRAIQSRARMYRCRVLAVGGLANHRHVVLQFTASVPLTVIANALMASSEVAVMQTFQMLHGVTLKTEQVWSAEYGIQTLAPGNMAATLEYIEHQAQHHLSQDIRPDLETVDTPREKLARPLRAALVRERACELVYR